MLEFLILFVLLDGKYTIYGMKKAIDGYFEFFNQPSFGAIHPAVKKLEEKKLINSKRDMSNGGQRRYLYGITNNGIKYFSELCFINEENLIFLDKMFYLKILAFDKLDDTTRNKLKIELLKTLELLTMSIGNTLSTIENKNTYRYKLLNHCKQITKMNTNWLNEL